MFTFLLSQTVIWNRQSTDTLFEDELASVTRSRNPSIKSKPKTSMISSNKDNFTELDTHNNPPAVSKDDMEELILPDTSEPITLYQGFRAIHPRLFKHAIKAKIHQSNLPSPYSSPLTITNTPKSSSTELATRPESKEKLKVTSVNIPSSPHFTNLPVKARHQASAIHNITRIFSDLLNERDLLLFEADELDSKRVRKHNPSCLKSCWFINIAAIFYFADRVDWKMN